MKIFIKTIRSNFKESKVKESHSVSGKNIRNENYLNTVNLTNKVVFNKDSKFINLFYINVTMKKVLVDINSNLRIVKYKKTKLIRFSSIEIVETSKIFKKLAQIIKKQSNSINVIKQILNTFIEIRLCELFNIFFELFRQMFCSIIDKKIKMISKKRKIIAQSKHIEEKKVHVESMKYNSTESMHLKKS